jgi:hypothetical protein
VLTPPADVLVLVLVEVVWRVVALWRRCVAACVDVVLVVDDVVVVLAALAAALLDLWLEPPHAVKALAGARKMAARAANRLTAARVIGRHRTEASAPI